MIKSDELQYAELKAKEGLSEKEQNVVHAYEVAKRAEHMDGQPDFEETLKALRTTQDVLEGKKEEKEFEVKEVKKEPIFAKAEVKVEEPKKYKRF